MNYIKEINAFMDWLEINPLEAITQALWFHIMAIANKSGWPEWFTIANLTLMARLNVSENTLIKHRNILIQKGRILYKNQGKKKAGKYKLIPFTSKNEANHSVKDNITSNIEVKREVKNSITSNIEVNREVNREVIREVNREVNPSALYKLNETKLNEDDDVINDNDPFVYYSKNIGPMLPYIADLIKQYQKDLPDELITEAFKIAVRNNARSMRYAEKIMLSWLNKGIRTMEDYKRHEAEWEHRKAAEGGREEAPTKRQYTQAEIEAAARYIKKAVSEYDGDDVIGYIRSLGYPEEISESAIALLIERKELAI